MSRRYIDVLDRVITDGIAEVERVYAESDARRAGAIEGFNACRNRTPDQLRELLKEAVRHTQEKWRESHDGEASSDDYWHVRYYDLQVEWVCNVISALLMNDGLPVIIAPTARGAMKAAEIVGVST